MLCYRFYKQELLLYVMHSMYGKRFRTGKMMEDLVFIRRYTENDTQELFSLIEREGEDWIDYWSIPNRPKYTAALRSSIVYLLFSGDKLCGYLRARDDNGYGVYVYDLLVDRPHRGKEYGRLLMKQVCRDFPCDDVYVMSGVDGYYDKLGYEKEGSIYRVQ